MERTILSIAGCAPRIFKEAGGKGFSIESRNLSFLLTVQLLRCTCYRLLRGSNVKDDRFVSSWNFSFVVDGERESCLLLRMYKCIFVGIKLYLIFIETFCYDFGGKRFGNYFL